MRYSSYVTKHVALLLFIILCSHLTHAQWTQTSNGIYGSQVTAMTSINETIFAGTVGGVFRSTDNATTWVPVNNGLAGSIVNSLISVGSTLYVALNGEGTYRSANNGTNWELISVPATLVRLATIGNTVYGMSNSGGVLYSISNTSTTATAITTNLTDVISFTVSGTTLFLGTISNGLYTSTDSGNTWVKFNADPFFKLVSSLDAKGSVILAWGDSKIFISTNSGASWSNTSVVQTAYTLGLLDNKILAGSQYGVEASADNGVSWSSLTSLPAMSAFTSNSSGYYAGTLRGVYRSTDGVSWNESNTGMIGGGVKSIVALNNKLFAASSNALYSSADWGITWQQLNAGIPYGQTVLALVSSGGNVVAGTYSGGVYTSSDGGTSWVQNRSMMGATCFVQLGGDLYAGNYSGVYVSKDNGTSWSLFSSIGFITTLGVQGNDLFVASNKLTRFSDPGQVNQTQKELSFSNPVSCFATLGNQFYCGTTNGGVFATVDNGETWTSSNNGLTSSFIVSSIIAHENYLYVSRLGEGVYYTSDNGISWKPYNSGLPSIVTNGFNSFLAMTVSGGKLFAGTSSAGVWSICPFLTPPVITVKDLETPNPVLTSSETVGNQWYYNGDPISNATGPSLTVTQSGAYYVEVPTSSGCKRKSADQAIVITGNIAPFFEAPMIDVFPNPSSNTVNIDLKKIPVGQHVAIEVFDIMGKNQKALIGHGGQQLILEIDEFAAGIYIVKSRNNNNLYLTRFIKQ